MVETTTQIPKGLFCDGKIKNSSNVSLNPVKFIRKYLERSSGFNPERRELLEGFVSRSGITIRNLALLNRAFTHRSYSHEKGGIEDFEKLEFLGDSVLGLIVTRYLYSHFPDLSEGELSRIKSKVVSESILSGVAERLDVGNCLLLGKGEKKSGGPSRPSTLADSLEAVIGVLYLERGMEAAGDFVLSFLTEEMERARVDSKDPKSRFQELVQKKFRETPSYRIIQERGPAHKKNFICAVYIGEREMARGEGNSRREAERDAAGRALEKV